MYMRPGDLFPRRTAMVERKEPKPERLFELALNKLRSLNVAAFVANGVVKGRIKIDPARMWPLEGVAFDRQQPFVVHGHDRLEFMAPSPLRDIGELVFFDVKDNPSLQQRIETTWKARAISIAQALAQAQQIAPEARLHPGTMSFEAMIQVGGGQARLRFIPDGTRAQVVAIDGSPLDPSTPWPASLFSIEARGSLAETRNAIAAAVAEARSILGVTTRADDRSPIQDHVTAEALLAPLVPLEDDEEPLELRTAFDQRPQIRSQPPFELPSPPGLVGSLRPTPSSLRPQMPSPPPRSTSSPSIPSPPRTPSRPSAPATSLTSPPRPSTPVFQRAAKTLPPVQSPALDLAIDSADSSDPFADPFQDPATTLRPDQFNTQPTLRPRDVSNGKSQPPPLPPPDLISPMFEDLRADESFGREPSDFELLLEDVVEPTQPGVDVRPIQARDERFQIEVPARLTIGDQVLPVTIVNVSAGGVFVSLDERDMPQVGEIVILGAFGTHSVQGRVAHRRGVGEGSLLGTPGGIGVAFMAEEEGGFGLRAVQEVPYGLVVMCAGRARDRAVQALVSEGCQVTFAENLAAASASFFLHHISIVLMDDSVHEGFWEDAAEALGLPERGIPVLLVTDPKRPLRDEPGWARTVEIEQLGPALIRSVLSG
jgi:hypothetical protein